MRKQAYSTVAAIGILACVAGSPVNAQSVAIDADDIGGLVTGPNGPEAGVWVIAETTDLPTRYTKSVVTDDQGRYVIPDLPTANYQRLGARLWPGRFAEACARSPGRRSITPRWSRRSRAAAAHYYPAIYWYTMMKLPPAKDFGGATDIPKNITRDVWRQRMNNVDCVGCHQLGQESTRTIPAQFGKFDSGADAWIRRVAAGQSGEMMTNRLAGQLGGVPYKYFGDWTDRVAKGELPKHKPARPAGVERNLVVTTWDWSTPDKYLHDLISSDRRKPTVNADGLLYGAPEYSTDLMPILDPKTHKVSTFKMPVADPNRCRSRSDRATPAPSSRPWRRPIGATRCCGTPRPTSTTPCSTTRAACGSPPTCAAWTIRPGARRVRSIRPRRCSRSSARRARWRCSIRRRRSIRSSTPASARITRSSATTPTTRCGSRAPARSPGWVNTKVWDETGDAQKAVGWFPFVLDSNGNGKLDEFAEPGKSEEGKDTRFNPGSGPYAVMPHPTDGSIWYTSGVFGGAPGFLRFDPKTKLSRVLSASRRKRSACAAATSARTACCGAPARPVI